MIRKIILHKTQLCCFWVPHNLNEDKKSRRVKWYKKKRNMFNTWKSQAVNTLRRDMNLLLWCAYQIKSRSFVAERILWLVKKIYFSTPVELCSLWNWTQWRQPQLSDILNSTCLKKNLKPNSIMNYLTILKDWINWTPSLKFNPYSIWLSTLAFLKMKMKRSRFFSDEDLLRTWDNDCAIFSKYDRCGSKIRFGWWRDLLVGMLQLHVN